MFLILPLIMTGIHCKVSFSHILALPSLRRLSLPQARTSQGKTSSKVKCKTSLPRTSCKVKRKTSLRVKGKTSLPKTSL